MPEAPPRVTIIIQAPSTIVARWDGPQGNVHIAGNLAGDPGERENTIEALRSALADLSDAWREDDGSSRVAVVIHGNREAKWNIVQYLMETMVHPTVKIYKMQFAVRRTTE